MKTLSNKLFKNGFINNLFNNNFFKENENAIAAMLVATLFVLAWILGFFAGEHSGSLIMASVAGVAGLGKHTNGLPLTTELSSEVSPELLRSEIDSRLVKIRPMSTPLDQISRYGGSRLSGSMKVEYYSVDTQPVTARLTADVAEGDYRLAGHVQAVISTDNNELFQPTTTILVPSVTANDGGALVLYVLSTAIDGVRVVAVNNRIGTTYIIPALSAGTELVRMGRAAGELDVMTPQFSSLPVKNENYCQIFKAQVEQSTFMKISNKEVGWSFTDQEESAIIDMRMGMEKNFLFGHKARFKEPGRGNEVMLTGGIWNQTDNDFRYSDSDATDDAWIVSLCRQAFSHNAGSSKKILLAGSDLIERLHRIGSTRVLINDAVVTKWGLDFTELHSKFGTLYVLLSEIFDQCGMSANGMVIDPEYITKYCHVPFRTERLNLRESGMRNVDAIVITEASCLVLRYPQSHMRIIHTPAAPETND